MDHFFEYVREHVMGDPKQHSRSPLVNIGRVMLTPFRVIIKVFTGKPRTDR